MTIRTLTAALLLAVPAAALAQGPAKPSAAKADKPVTVRKVPVGPASNLIRGNSNSDLPESSMCEPCDPAKLAKAQQQAGQKSDDDNIRYRHLRKPA